ncbi:hypothetical protein DJ528_11285, partial [Sulfolobus sp. B5]
MQLVLQINDDRYLIIDDLVRTFDGKIKTKESVIGYRIVYDAGKVKILNDFKVYKITDDTLLQNAIL